MLFHVFFDSLGMAEFLPSKKQSKAKVLTQLNRAKQPGCHSISVQWSTLPRFQAPVQIFSVFNEERQLVYALLGTHFNRMRLKKLCRFQYQ